MSEKAEPRKPARQEAIAVAVTPELVRQAAENWAAQQRAPVPVRAVQNFVYEIEASGGPAILRLTHESHRSREEVGAELQWLLDLRQRGLPVPDVLPSGRGALSEIADSAAGKFIVACFERVEGCTPDPRTPEFWRDEMFEQLGALIARLHQASYEAHWRPATLGRRTFRDESVVQNFHLYIPAEQTKVHDAFDRVLARLDRLPRTRDVFGLIHADLNHANFVIAPSGLKIFDFDDSDYSWFAYDLLVPIFHFPLDEPELMQQRATKAFRALLRGYGGVRRFNPVWLEWLPLLCQWRDLLVYSFFHEQFEIASLPEKARRVFLAMRERIETGRPIADLSAGG